jgi:hypothetical protein
MYVAFRYCVKKHLIERILRIPHEKVLRVQGFVFYVLENDIRCNMWTSVRVRINTHFVARQLPAETVKLIALLCDLYQPVCEFAN